MEKVPNDWEPKVGEKIWINEFFLIGMEELEIVKIVDNQYIICKHDGIEHWVNLNYYRPDIFIA